MAYDQALAERVRHILAEQSGVVEKKMFGGLTFMLKGNMCCGVLGDDLVVRLGPNGHQQGLAQPGVRPMDFTGRPLKGMLYISPDGHGTEEGLRRWVDQAVEYALSLPQRK